MGLEDAKNKVEAKAEELKQKAEARSEDIEGTIEKKIGEMDNDQETIEAGEAKQEKAEELRDEAESK